MERVGIIDQVLCSIAFTCRNYAATQRRGIRAVESQWRKRDNRWKFPTLTGIAADWSGKEEQGRVASRTSNQMESFGAAGGQHLLFTPPSLVIVAVSRLLIRKLANES
jgi:hypothetical protein